MRMAEIPDARNVASEDEIPACWKRRGAYYAEDQNNGRGSNRDAGMSQIKLNETFVYNTVYTTQLLHTHHKDT